MPRRNALLPFVKRDRNGRFTYFRNISPELREFLGGKASIRRTLATDSTDISSTAVLTAYSAVQSEVEALISQAKEAIKRSNRSITPGPEQIPLSPRDIAGISAEPLRQMVDALQNGRISGANPEQLQEMVSQLLAQALIAQASGDISGIQQSLAGLTAPVLDELGISASSADQQRINQQLMRYAADAREISSGHRQEISQREN